MRTVDTLAILVISIFACENMHSVALGLLKYNVFGVDYPGREIRTMWP